MNSNNTENLIRRLTFENYIWGIYLVVALFNIYGDELIKKSIRENDRNANRKARTIFLAILIVTLLINIYFLIRNYSDLKQDFNNESLRIRFLGSIFLLLATLSFLYSQLKTEQEEESVSNI